MTTVANDNAAISMLSAQSAQTEEQASLDRLFKHLAQGLERVDTLGQLGGAQAAQKVRAIDVAGLLSLSTPQVTILLASFINALEDLEEASRRASRTASAAWVAAANTPPSLHSARLRD